MENEKKYLATYPNGDTYFDDIDVGLDADNHVAIVEQDEYESGNTTVRYSSQIPEAARWLHEQGEEYWLLKKLISRLNHEIYLLESEYDKLVKRTPDKPIDVYDIDHNLIDGNILWNDSAFTFYVCEEEGYTPPTPEPEIPEIVEDDVLDYSEREVEEDNYLDLSDIAFIDGEGYIDFSGAEDEDGTVDEEGNLIFNVEVGNDDVLDLSEFAYADGDYLQLTI